MAYLGVLAEVLLAEVNQVVDGDLAAVVDVAHLEDAPQQLEGVALGRRRRRRRRRRRFWRQPRWRRRRRGRRHRIDSTDATACSLSLPNCGFNGAQSYSGSRKPPET